MSRFKNRIHDLCDLTNLPKYELADGIIDRNETYNMSIKVKKQQSTDAINTMYM